MALEVARRFLRYLMPIPSLETMISIMFIVIAMLFSFVTASLKSCLRPPLSRQASMASFVASISSIASKDYRFIPQPKIQKSNRKILSTRVCLNLCQSDSLDVSLFFYLVFLNTRLSCWFVCLLVVQYVFLSVCLSVCLSVYLSIGLPDYVPVSLPI